MYLFCLHLYRFQILLGFVILFMLSFCSGKFQRIFHFLESSSQKRNMDLLAPSKCFTLTFLWCALCLTYYWGNGNQFIIYARSSMRDDERFYDSNWMFYAKVSQPNCWALNWCKIVMVGEGRILKVVILVQYFLRWCLNLVLSSPDLRICQLEIIDVMFGWGRSASFVYYFFKNSFNYVLIVLPGADREMTHLVIAVFARNHKIWKWNDWRRSEWTFKSEQGKLSWHS